MAGQSLNISNIFYNNIITIKESNYTGAYTHSHHPAQTCIAPPSEKPSSRSPSLQSAQGPILVANLTFVFFTRRRSCSPVTRQAQVKQSLPITIFDRNTNQGKTLLSQNGPLDIYIDMLHILAHIRHGVKRVHLTSLADVTDVARPAALSPNSGLATSR